MGRSEPSAVSDARFAAVLLLILASMLGLPAARAQTESTESPVLYRPSDDTVKFTDMAQAEAAIRKLATLDPQHQIFIAPPDFSGSDRLPVVESVTFESGSLVLQLRNPSQAPLLLRYDSLNSVEVISHRAWYADHAGVRVRPDLVLWARTRRDYQRSTEIATALADALFALYKIPVEEARRNAEFGEVVAKYRAASPKPALTEDVRKYQVQAEFLIKQKRFADAAQLYDQGLKLAPWWPQGHFNRGLILGELERYQEATREMERYLQLEPDAPNARAVQDRIYQWEAAQTIKKEGSEQPTTSVKKKAAKRKEAAQ